MNTKTKMLTLEDSLWQRIKNELGIKIPQDTFKYSSTNPVSVVKAVVNAKNHKWLEVCCREILKTYKLGVVENEGSISLAFIEEVTDEEQEQGIQFLKNIKPFIHD